MSRSGPPSTAFFRRTNVAVRRDMHNARSRSRGVAVRVVEHQLLRVDASKR